MHGIDGCVGSRISACMMLGVQNKTRHPLALLHLHKAHMQMPQHILPWSEICSIALCTHAPPGSVAREARSTAPKAPRPRSGRGTRRCFFNEECLDSTAGAI